MRGHPQAHLHSALAPCHRAPPTRSRSSPARPGLSPVAIGLPPALTSPPPAESHAPHTFPHPPPVFTGPPSSPHSRAAQTALRLAQIDRWPSHTVTRAEWHRLARRAQAPCARTCLGRGPSPTAGASLTPACAPLRTGGGPHFFACAPRPKPLRAALNLGARPHPCHHPAAAQRARSHSPRRCPIPTR